MDQNQEKDTILLSPKEGDHVRQARYFSLISGVIFLGVGFYDFFVIQQPFFIVLLFVLFGLSSLVWSWRLFHPSQKSLPKIEVDGRQVIIKISIQGQAHILLWDAIETVIVNSQDLTIYMNNGKGQRFKLPHEELRKMEEIRNAFSRWKPEKTAQVAND